MLTKRLSCLLLPVLALCNSFGSSGPQLPTNVPEYPNGTLERLIVASGDVVMDLDLNRLTGAAVATQKSNRTTFQVRPNSFFTIRAFNKALRGVESGSMELISGNCTILPEPLAGSTNELVVEKTHSGRYELVVRDGHTGFIFFDVEGSHYEYDAAARMFSIKSGRLSISGELAHKLGHPEEAGTIVGEISIVATMVPIEITAVANGRVQSTALPPRAGGSPGSPDVTVPGPDIIVGDLPSLEQFGAGGSQVGLGVGTTSCNNGNVEVDWFELPNTDHCVIPQNLYRMSGGPSNSERFEQIGQSWMKHAFFALQENACSACIPAQSGTHLGVGCSDPYEAGLNALQDFLGSRAWVNPFTGSFPSTSANHGGHVHTGTSHRIIVETNDLNTATNPGATYFAEAQYVTPHEYAWCQKHPGECNMYNNASYRQFNVTGTTNFTFSPVASTVRMMPAINAWPGATIRMIEPEPGVDGRAFLAYKVTNSAQVWHYEYAIYNQNLDRGIQSFSIPLPTPLPFSVDGSGIDAYFDPGFHAPPQQPGFAADGTEGDAGFSAASWAFSENALVLTWKSETFEENPNANAIRWGTLYNFRFDSLSPPKSGSATIGFFKTGSPVDVAIDVPAAGSGPTPTPLPPTPTPTATPISPPHAVNLSTRLRIDAGPGVGIGGFIITGTNPIQVLIRGIGPSLLSIPNLLADPMLELHGPGNFVTVSNNNWQDTQEQEIIATGIPPSNDLESAILATLDPGAYTAILSGNNGGTGTGVVEIYDLSQEKNSKLANISTRGNVGLDFDVMIAGFILSAGSIHDVILIRGIGPSLSAHGVANALAHPVLELRDSQGTFLAFNDGWQNGPPVSLPPDDPLESAIQTSLSPGAYTALLLGVNRTIGVALVEVYDLGSP